jgi:GNAT superfamily N-acetyltransferase
MNLTTPSVITAGALAERAQPTLATTDGLLLRPWEPADAAVFFAAYQDPAIRRWHTRQPASEAQARCAYWVLPAARSAGVAPRALTALTVWAFEDIGFHRLELDHSTRNEASCRVAAKAGFLVEGIRRSAAVHADGRHDMHLHARIRDLPA